MRPSQTCSAPDPGQVYQPAEDSVLLLRAASREIRSTDRVLEVGTGSGFVLSGLSSCCCTVGTDINPHAARISGDRGLQMVRTDLAAGLRQVFDLVLFNPPYLPTQPDERLGDWLEYALDGGPDGRVVIGRFLREIDDAIVPGGRILLLISSLTGKDETQAMIQEAGWVCSLVDEERIEGGELLYVLRLTR